MVDVEAKGARDPAIVSGRTFGGGDMREANLSLERPVGFLEEAEVVGSARERERDSLRWGSEGGSGQGGGLGIGVLERERESLRYPSRAGGKLNQIGTSLAPGTSTRDGRGTQSPITMLAEPRLELKQNRHTSPYEPRR
ncbi:hypothetical protein NL676_024677 [Syzygium grande]|nr:hypothetical protein NL676_024677 [Syzygium grande]